MLPYKEMTVLSRELATPEMLTVQELVMEDKAIGVLYMSEAGNVVLVATASTWKIFNPVLKAGYSVYSSCVCLVWVVEVGLHLLYILFKFFLAGVLYTCFSMD